MVEWIDPYAGFEFSGTGVTVSREYQEEKLAVIGLDPGVFGDCVDPSFYIGIGIRAGIEAGISAEGNVNMLSSIVMHRPVSLGEALTAKGRIEAVDEVPRGHQVTTDVWFEGADGQRAISVPRRSLRPDPEKAKQGAGARPPPVVADTAALELGAGFALTPEATKAYSSEGNSIHYEMEAANKAGFRAPIIGGGMGVHFLMVRLWGKARNTLNLDIYFRRPIFWDHVFSVGQMEGAMALVSDGKVLTEARVNEVS